MNLVTALRFYLNPSMASRVKEMFYEFPSFVLPPPQMLNKTKVCVNTILLHRDLTLILQENIISLGPSCLMKGISWNQMYLLLDISTTRPSGVCLFLSLHERCSLSSIVRCLPPGAPDLMSGLKAPFIVEGARNVFLETVKRGEYDPFDEPASFDKKEHPTTIVLRMYEAYGGHAQAKLLLSNDLPVVKAFITNLLEDEDEELYLLRSDEANAGSALSLSFRGFEVKTIKLVLGALPPNPSQKRVSVFIYL